MRGGDLAFRIDSDGMDFCNARGDLTFRRCPTAFLCDWCARGRPDLPQCGQRRNVKQCEGATWALPVLGGFGNRRRRSFVFCAVVSFSVFVACFVAIDWPQ